MRIISKKISLTPYISKFNGTLSSYNEYGTLQNSSEFKPYDGTKMNNYNMFPLDVIYNGKILSYPTLMERYYFCKRYEEMLKYDNCIDGGKYLDAVTYYYHNFIYQTEELKNEYEDLDTVYKEYGGSGFTYWCDSILKGGNAEQSIYFYACQEIKGENNEGRCENYQLLAKEGEYICPKCGKNLSLVEGVYNDEFIYSFHINIPILFTNTIDDLGEFSIFCGEWEEGVKYQEGDIAIYDDEIWLKNNQGYGSEYVEEYKELIFSTSEWTNYTDANLSANTNTDTKYSVKNGRIFYGNDVNADNMADKYDIISNDDDLGFYVVNNNIFKPFKSEYIIYADKTTTITNEIPILVQNCDNFIQLNMKYCYIKGQKIFSKTDDGTNHYFIIDEPYKKEEGKDYKDKYDVISEGIFIEINGEIIQVDNNQIIVNNITYNKINSYSIIEGKKYFISNDNFITFKRNPEGTEYTLNVINTDLGAKEINANKDTIGYNIKDNKVYVYKPYNEYSTSKISGYTESKLSSLLNYRRFKDDMGNELPGALKEGEDGFIVSPKEGDVLEIPYKVGNVSDLTVIEYDEDGKTPKTFFGNILTNITYYDTTGETKTKIENSSKLEEIFNKTDEIHNVSCELEYQMGAIFTKNENEFCVISDGVRYKDTVSVTKETCDYKLDDVSSFILYYYKFEYYNTFDKYNEYCDAYVKTNKSYFEHDLIFNEETEDEENENEDECKKTNIYRAEHDGMIYAPVFREEYKIGSSSLENIQSDIYIDRGFSSSFERHLNLLSVKSMEALENFGNGFYNIIES